MKRLILQAAVATMVLAPLVSVSFAQVTSGASESADQIAVRKVLMDTWDKPGSRLDAGPIVVVGDRAIAGWTQDSRGGRALLVPNAHGKWAVSVCAGDGLKDPKALESMGMSASAARELSRNLVQAEAKTTPQRRALFSTFDGMVKMDAEGHHPPHAQGGKH